MKFGKILLKYLTQFIATYTVLTLLLLLTFRFVHPSVTSFILYKSNSENFVLKNNSSSKINWISIKRTPKNLIKAIIASEDQRFFDHWGFDIHEIENSIEDIYNHKRVRGASTITQQVAKNVFLTPSKTIFRKILESYYTVMIELVWSKKYILEVYINTSETNKNTFGFSNGAEEVFNKNINKLTRYELAELVSYLPNPQKYYRIRKSKFISSRKTRIILRMKNLQCEKEIDNLYKE